jgi:UDP-2,4-diacetamido-2,4,6-trideoxy-beta-L-altropyranose hydrolase
LLDQNYYSDMETRYEKLVQPHCKKMLGPKYALLRPEFKEARGNLKVRDGSVKRIFVFFGGSDPTNETGKALRAIQQFGRPDIAIDVVVGSTNPHQEEIASLCAQLANTQIHRQVNNMAELMARADVAIGAGGGTMWERCSLGLPTIVVSVAENQQPGCEAVARLGAILYLGGSVCAGVELFEAALHVAMSSPAFLKSMSEKCETLVDGQGVKRIARQLIAPAIILRRATLADCESMFNWRNAEETRQFSSATSPISIEEHRVWYNKTLENSNRQLLIGESDQQAVGVLRFDRDGKRAVTSVYLVPGNYGKGIGGRLIEQGNAWVKQHWPEVNSIEAVIMEGNAASMTAFLEAGFKRCSYTYVKQIGN